MNNVMFRHKKTKINKQKYDVIQIQLLQSLYNNSCNCWVC